MTSTGSCQIDPRSIRHRVKIISHTANARRPYELRLCRGTTR